MEQPVRRPFPLFRYHPFPVYTGSIRPEAISCPICNLHSDYCYEFQYAPPDDEGGTAEERAVRTCPWCLHDGRAAGHYPGASFNDPPVAPGISQAAQDELAQRTPSYYTFQEMRWPVHHDDYCAFIGYVGWKEIAAYVGEMQGDLDELRRLTQWNKEELEHWPNGASVQGYLFRCLTCGVHRLTADME